MGHVTFTFSDREPQRIECPLWTDTVVRNVTPNEPGDVHQREWAAADIERWHERDRRYRRLRRLRYVLYRLATPVLLWAGGDDDEDAPTCLLRRFAWRAAGRIDVWAIGGHPGPRQTVHVGNCYATRFEFRDLEGVTALGIVQVGMESTPIRIGL